jgi:cytochrome P450
MSIDVFFPPGPQKSLFLGNAPQFHHNPFQFLIESAHTYGEIVHFRFGPTHAYLLCNPGYAHDVLVERSDKFAEAPNLLRALNSAFGHDLTPPSDKPQKRPRHSTFFQPRWLDSFADHTAALAAENTAAWADGQPREIVAELKRLTLKIISHMLFDTATTDITARIANDIFFSRQLQDRRFQSPLTLPEWVPTAANRKQQQAGLQVNSLIEQMIADHRAQPGRYQGVLARLLDAADAHGGRIEQVTHARDEAVTLFQAGHETTAHTLAWAFYLLAINPEAESLLHAELDSVLGGRLPTADDVPNLPYTEMVLRETLRLYPPAWLISRQAKTEVRVANYYLPSGSSVFVSPYIIHRNRRYFTTPDMFIPERFAEGFDRRMPRSAYMPFGAGQRATVEQALALHEATLMLATIASRFTLALEPGQTVTPEAGLTMRPLGGLKMRAQAR